MMALLTNATWAHAAGFTVLFALGLGALFVWEGIRDDYKRPPIRHLGACCVSPTERHGPRAQRVRILTWNIAKVEFHQGGLRFRPAKEVRTQLDAIATVIRQANADIVVVTEIVKESGPFGIDQVEYLARALQARSWVFGANYSFGIPGVRIQAGKAILARAPLYDARAMQLADKRPFWNPTNNRRLLMAAVILGDQTWTVGAVRNDSYSLDGNLVHAREMLEACSGHACLLVGDFNAPPDSASMRLVEESGRFSGAFDGPPTHPAIVTDESGRRIDYVLAPPTWKLIRDEVIDSALSDHRPVVAEFELP